MMIGWKVLSSVGHPPLLPRAALGLQADDDGWAALIDDLSNLLLSRGHFERQAMRIAVLGYFHLIRFCRCAMKSYLIADTP